LPDTFHLRPHAEVAERALLPGDPGRALRLAQQLVDNPKMLNHHRGLWGYTGVAADGLPLTIQSTGLGGPSTAIVAEELIALGARRLVRLGTAIGLFGGLRLGDLVIAESVLPGDGTSRALGASAALPADPALLAQLRAAAPGARVGVVASADVRSAPAPGGAVALDLSAAALFAAAARDGAVAACVLAVSETRGGGRIDPEDLERAEVELGRVGAAAFA
jgi:uridine phosphorylase